MPQTAGANAARDAKFLGHISSACATPSPFVAAGRTVQGLVFAPGFVASRLKADEHGLHGPLCHGPPGRPHLSRAARRGNRPRLRLRGPDHNLEACNDGSMIRRHAYPDFWRFPGDLPPSRHHVGGGTCFCQTCIGDVDDASGDCLDMAINRRHTRHKICWARFAPAEGPPKKSKQGGAKRLVGGFG